MKTHGESWARGGRRGSLLVIFLFTTGLLAVLMTGLYFVMNASAVGQSFVESQGAKRRVAEGLDQLYRSELERLSRYYVSNGLQAADFAQGDAVTAGTYTYALVNATKWGFNSRLLKEAGDANPGGLAFTSWPSVPLFWKSNALAENTGFGEHPLSFVKGATDATATLGGTFTPTWSDRSFAYSRNFVCYREIPVCFMPFSAAYNVASYSPLRAVNLGGGPVVLFAGDTGGTEPRVRPSFGGSAPAQPLMLSTHGIAPEKMADYANVAGTIASRQQYKQDAEVILDFDGTAVTREGGGAVPAGVSVASFDGRNRVVVDLSQSYANQKYYVRCVGGTAAQTDEARAAGVVLMDTGSYDVSRSLSWATDGMLYLWENTASDSPKVAATSYGAVGLADANYDGTSPAAHLNLTFHGAVSAYTKSVTLFDDTFSRGTDPATSALDGSTPTTSSEGANATWGSGSAGINCSGSGTASGSGWCLLGIGHKPYEGGLIGFYLRAALSSGATARVRLINGGSYTAGSTQNMDFSVTTDGSLFTAGYQLETYPGPTLADDGTDSSAVDGGGQSTFGFFFAPGTNEVFVTVNGTLVLKKKLTTPLAALPDYLVLDISNNVTVDNFSIVKNPLGMLLGSPQADYDGTCNVTFKGGVAVGEGIASALDANANVNFLYENAVGTALGNYCERVLVHYPYFY